MTLRTKRSAESHKRGIGAKVSGGFTFPAPGTEAAVDVHTGAHLRRKTPPQPTAGSVQS